MTDQASEPNRSIPSRKWYALAGAILIVTFSVYVMAVVSQHRSSWAFINAWPRFIVPDEQGAVVTIDKPGEYVIYYENRGTLDGRSFDTPRRQIWTTAASPAMTCAVTRLPENTAHESGEALDSGGDSGGEVIDVHLRGDVGPVEGESPPDTELLIAYKSEQRVGYGVWGFVADQPGEYRIQTAYVEAVYLTVEDIAVPEELTREAQAQMTFAQAQAYSQNRRDMEERLELAAMEPIEVLVAVGQDPTQGGYFNFIGLKGAAAVAAVGFTAASIIALVVLMLRTGQVTERGTLEEASRGLYKR